MAAGTNSDIKVFPEQVQSGYFERVSQAFDAFNGASAGAIVLASKMLKGNYSEEAFWKFPNGIVRRDPTSAADASDSKLSQSSIVAPKIPWRYGPFAITVESFRTMARDPQEFSFMLGQKVGEELAVTMINSACAALKGCYYAGNSAGAAARKDSSGDTTGTSTYDKLVSANALLGDRGAGIVAYLMDGVSSFKLAGNAIADKMDSVAGVFIQSGTPATLGKRMIVTDSSYLRVDAASTSSDYSMIYGLFPGAVVLTDSSEMQTHVSIVDDKENLLVRYRTEGTFNLEIRGFTFTTATANPSDSQLATGSNWTLAASSIKDGAGFLSISKGNFN